ncbi:MAG: orotate phosphoribosyltransferase [Chlamydiales bacterium]|nr:orotate phosphoribosyltransferase [Chlamydiales bacterium]
MNTRQLALALFEIQAIKFGSFTLKSGLESPIYLDLRLIISFPSLLKEISEMMWKKAENLSFDLVCGVPYTALPLATCLSVLHDVPMILRRKEVKEYGTKKRIEGVFEQGQSCLILEDVITTGSSILETCHSLSEEGLQVKDAIVIVDRQQGARTHLQEKGIRTHSLTTLSELVNLLYDSQKIDRQLFQTSMSVLQQ